MTPEEHIAYWKKAAGDADKEESALIAFGVYAGLSMAEQEYSAALKQILKKLVFAARTSGGWQRDELLCSVCDEAERLLQG